MTRKTAPWALVTGAAQRIGRATALGLAEHGWDIVIHYNRSQADAVATARAIEQLGRKAFLAEVDFADLKRVKKLIPALTEELGAPSALINNASIFVPDDETVAPNIAAINTDAPRILSEAFRKHAFAGGTITNLLDADPTARAFSFYNASKLALARLTEDMARAFAPNLRVNGVALGPVMRGTRETPGHFAKLVARMPLKSEIAPAEVVRAIMFLIHEPHITGTIIPVDGGLHLTRGGNGKSRAT